MPVSSLILRGFVASSDLELWVLVHTGNRSYNNNYSMRPVDIEVVVF